MRIGSYTAFVVSFLCMLCSVCTSGHAVELAFDQGVCEIDANGTLRLRLADAKIINVNYSIVLPEWRFYDQITILNYETVSETKIVLTGQLKTATNQYPLQITMVTNDGKLQLDFATQLPKDLQTQNDLAPLVILSTPLNALKDTLVQINSNVYRLPSNNTWIYGDSLYLAYYEMLVKISGDKRSISIWDNGKSTISFRIGSTLAEETATSKNYQATLTFSAEKIKLTEPVDMIQLKREQYLRILYPPQEPEFKPQKMIDLLNSPQLDKEIMQTIEKCLDIRSSLYSIREKIAHLASSNQELTTKLTTAYNKLNETDYNAVFELIPELEKLSSAITLPQTQYNPYSWIKSFTQYGYYKHNDGCYILEPSPYSVLYQDGLHFAFASDPEVKLIGKGAFKQVRFDRPMTDASVERSWIDSKWNLPDKTITFSMLTPVIDIEGTDTLVLSEFNRPPTSVICVNENMRAWGGAVTNWQVEAEILASVLAEDQEKMQSTRGEIGKQYKFTSGSPGRPWIILRSETGGWDLIITLGAKPLYAQYKDGKFILKLAEKSFFGIVRLPSMLHFREAPQLGEFFAATTLNYPIGAEEIVTEQTVTWKYRYKERTNAWDTVAQQIAPLSPLLQLGDIVVPGAKKSLFATKYGMYSYLYSDTATFTLPVRPKNDLLFGVNTELNKQHLLEHKQNGAQWQRLFMGRSKDIDTTFKLYEETLEFCAANNIKVLVDPHDFFFRISWSEGLPGNGEDSHFLELWDRLSQIGAKYRDIIAGYDLYNELPVKEGAEYQWRQMTTAACEIIRKNHPDAVIYVTGVDMANTSGYFNYAPPAIDNIVLTFHFYTPHSFTHQKAQTSVPNDPFVFYPGYSPMINWTKKIHYSGETVDWFDRWQLSAAMLPVWEASIRNNLPVHCGEFAVVGWANAAASRSAFSWTRDVCEILDHAAVSWHIWNKGFGLGNKQVREYIYSRWNQE